MSRSRAVLLVALVMLIPAIAGCVGSQSQPGSQDPAADGTDADTTDDGSDAGSSGDGADDGSGSSEAPSSDEGDGSGDGSDEPAGYRTPDAAMPNLEPAATGDGWARWEIQGTARTAVNYYAVEAGSCGALTPAPGDPTGSVCAYDYNVTLRSDVTRVEAVLTWDSDTTNLDLFLVDSTGDRVTTSTHGMEAAPTDTLPLLLASNGTQWEHIAVPGEALEMKDYVVRVQERNVWDPQAAQDGLTFNLMVWVHTAPVDGTCPTWEPDPCGPT